MQQKLPGTTLATSIATQSHRQLAFVFCIAFAVITLLLLPLAATPSPPIPGFLAIYQTTLILVFALTSYTLATQFIRAHSLPLLIISAGSLFTAAIVFLQLLSFPGIIGSGRVLGSTPDTTIWLWTFWHVGPPIYALVYAYVVRGGTHPVVSRTDAVPILLLGLTLALAGAIGCALLSTSFVHLLPRSVDGDDYRALITSGVGPSVEIATLTAIVCLWRSTRKKRTLLELWLIVSLVLLALDNVITFAGLVRGSIGWFAGRLEALVSAALIFIVYLREIDRLHERALRAEAELRQSQKMEAIGQLTGGIAHDFNNLLTVIVGGLDMLRRKPEDRARVLRTAEHGLAAAERGQRLTKQLLMFARKETLRPEIVNVNQLVRQFDGLLQGAAGESIEICFELDPTLAPAKVDTSQLQAALLNLVVNARDAMPNGGKITIKTSNAMCGDEYVEANPDASDGPHVVIEVSDSGIGMDETTAARAIEPFFTTKGVGQGSGLGLSQVYGFVRSFDGHLRIKSEFGHGTTVQICLPAQERTAPAPTIQPSSVPLRRALNGERILVVEDDTEVLHMVMESLSELGYQVETAENAVKALDRLRAGETFDILFSDVVMPGGMNGIQLVVEAKRLRPPMKVLLTSGYSESSLHQQSELRVPILRKPYKQDDLVQHLKLVS